MGGGELVPYPYTRDQPSAKIPLNAPILFDAVIFDLDGTLVATNRFWVRAARVGAKKAFGELGIERSIPVVSEWMSMVGLPIEQGFDNVFPDLTQEQRDHVRKRCIEEEERALKAGGAALLPDTREVLEHLHRSGVRMAIASNCGQFYLDNMLESLELKRWIELPLCLDSPGIRTKRDMIATALERFETRSAIMVGDRDSDRDAAWANGLPHVHLTTGYADERVICEATIDGIGELLPLFEGRRRLIDSVLESRQFRALGVTGPRGSGKSLFARDLARTAGNNTKVIALEWFRRAERTPDATVDPLVEVAALYDLDLLEKELFQRSEAGEAVRLKTRSLPGARGLLERVPDEIKLEPGAPWILEGPFLAHPRIARGLERLLALEASEETCARRIAGREERGFGPASLLELRSAWWPLERAFEALLPAESRADRVLGPDPFGQGLSVPGAVE